MIRAIFNEFHAGGEYAKGKQREFEAWRKKKYPAAMWLPFERAAGSRQDLAFDGALPIFLNRLIVVEFLQELVTVPNADNKLEKFIWRVLKCNQVAFSLSHCIALHPTPPHPISHPIPSHPIPSHLTLPYPIPSHPIPSHLIPLQPTPSHSR